MSTGLIATRLTERADPWIHGRPVQRAQVRLFCLPYSGAGASVFRAWSGAFPASMEVRPVQLPGREDRLAEPAFRRMNDLAPAVVRAVLPYLDKPFAIFGHSLGALVGFEVARLLQAEHGVGPELLFASGHTAPHDSDHEAILHSLPDGELAQKLRELGGTPEAVLQHEELRRLLFPLLRADFEVCETYRYEPAEPLRCPILALGGLGDDDVSRESLEEWRRHTLAGFGLRMFPGDHFFLNSCGPEVVRTVVRALAGVLLPRGREAPSAAAEWP
jgi:medium-chain acyl-[acyl-carrier-protein] hydrolase